MRKSRLYCFLPSVLIGDHWSENKDALEYRLSYPSNRVRMCTSVKNFYHIGSTINCTRHHEMVTDKRKSETRTLDSPSLYSYLSLEVEADLWMGGRATSTVGCFCFASSGLEFSRPESANGEDYIDREENKFRHN